MPFSLIDFLTKEPAPITISSPTVMPFAKTDWLPTNTLLPTLQSPCISVPVEICHWSQITASCSIFVMVLSITLTLLLVMMRQWLFFLTLFFLTYNHLINNMLIVYLYEKKPLCGYNVIIFILSNSTTA